MFFYAFKYIFQFNNFYIVSNKKVPQGCIFLFFLFFIIVVSFLKFKDLVGDVKVKSFPTFS